MQSVLRPSGLGVSGRRLRPDGRRVVIAVNWTETPRKATLARGLVPLGESEPVTTVVVPARSGAVLIQH